MKKLLMGMAASLLAVNANAALIEIYESEAGIGSIAGAKQVIADSTGPVTSTNSDSIWFSDVGTWGASAFPGNHTHTFVLTAEGTVDTNAYDYLWIAHDDGVELSVDDAVKYDWNGNTDYRNSGAISLGASGGVKDFDLLFWENGGEADLFLWGRNRQTHNWEIAQIGDVASVSEPGTLALLGLGLAGLGLTRRKTKA